ncbi:MAG: VWA containing CoxE family protein, partial [Chloroflexota bacterium]
RNELPGIAWLQRLAAHFTHRVWLNPEEPRFWVAYTAQAIRQLFPMFPLSIEGIGQAVKRLVVREAAPLNQR